MMRIAVLNLLAAASVSAQAPNYVQAAENAIGKLDFSFTGKGFNGMEWWQQGVTLTTVADMLILDPNYNKDGMNIVTSIYASKASKRKRDAATGGEAGEPKFDPAKREESLADKWASMFSRRDDTPNWSAYIKSYYDDNGWWSLAWIAAYDATQDPKYLALGQAMFDNNIIKSSQNPENKCGGVVWSDGNPYVNAITNELFLSVTAHLANRVPGPPADNYLQLAKNQWQWFQNSGMINSDSTINDGLDGNCKNNNGPVWTYNQGVVLGALVELNKKTQDPAYLASAKQIALGAISALTGPDHILHEPCDQNNNCDKNQVVFKGPFMHNLMQLNKVAPDPAYQAVIRASANAIIQNNVTSPNWGEGTLNTNTWCYASQDAAVSALIAAATL